MPKLAQLPANDGAPDHEAALVRRIPRFRHRYFAFLSYSHKDEEIADWLHDELEEFRVPHALAGRLTANGVIPKRLRPIFRDRHELAAADDLGEEIKSALASSQYLIVLCSPNAAKSHWTNAEIESFKRTRPDGCVLAAIAAGEPFASDIPGREDEECFPPALRQKYDRRGRPTGKRAEPLAADLRDTGDGRRMGFLKLVAGMLGVGLDDLVQREQTRRQRRLAWLAAASLGGMAVTSGLAFTAIQARDAARDQRREAEGLIGFMLGDLKDKLEPIGKLDALDGVGARVLAYYQKVGTADLSDAALSQRSRALSLMAQVGYLRGNLDGAVRLYREAMAGTGEAMQRNPDDPQALFDHAQNVFWIGEIARLRGDLRTAEQSAREYKRLAAAMVALGPDNMKWRMEEQNADAELGIVFQDQRRLADAANQFDRSLRTIEALATADPSNREYQKSLTESLAWSADAQSAAGRLDDAIASRQRNIEMLNRLSQQSGGDVEYRLKLIPAHRALGNLYAVRGQTEPALEQLRTAAQLAEQLIPTEPNNQKWIEYAANAEINLAQALVTARRLDEAAAQTDAGCARARESVGRDPRAANRRATWRNCLLVRAELALAGGAVADASNAAARALEVANSVKSSDTVADQFARAKAYRLVGDIRKQARDYDGARAAWAAALSALPRNVAEKPSEMNERVLILTRLGRTRDAAPLTARLAAIGYRRTS